MDFSAAFNKVNVLDFVFQLQEAGVRRTNFLSSRTLMVKIDGVCSSSIVLVSGVPQVSVLGPLLFLL